MSYLYVMEHGATIGLSGGYFVVKYKNEMEKKIPKEMLESISLFGNILLTTQCIEECLKRGISINYFSKTGVYFGRLDSTRHVNIFRQKQQLLLTEEDTFSLCFSKKIIEAKIHNQKVILRRYLKKENSIVGECIKNLEIAIRKINHCKNYNELIGYEGFAAKYYFRGLEELIDKKFEFHGRNRMPPKDPFNSLLSLGYTILMYEIYGQIESRGLQPYAGFLHKDKERHPTLASDLMEEWRAVVVDSTVMSLIQGHEIQPDMFQKDSETGGVYLNREAMKIFINKIEKKFCMETNYLSYIDYRVSYRRAFWLQTGQLVKAIEEKNADVYEPIRIR
jgi:CRISPR-associated protein Cas1